MDFVAVGRLGAPKGVRGDLKVHSYSGESAHFRKLEIVELRPERSMHLGPERSRDLRPVAATPSRAAAPTAAATQPKSLRLKVLRVEGEGSSLTIAFEGYASPEDARALTGMDIVVPRSDASPLGPNQWYINDLVGLMLVSGGVAVARVASVLEGGAEPWLEAVLSGDVPGSGGPRGRGDPEGRRAIVPFRKEFVGEVDVEAGTIELLAPELLEGS